MAMKTEKSLTPLRYLVRGAYLSAPNEHHVQNEQGSFEITVSAISVLSAAEEAEKAISNDIIIRLIERYEEIL